jgi:hypothetical protein
MTMLEAASATQQEAAERVRRRTGQRHQKIEAITTGQLVLADEPIRIASRIERLSRYYPSVRPVSPAALVANDPEAVQAAGAVLERIITPPTSSMFAIWRPGRAPPTPWVESMSATTRDEYLGSAPARW